MEERDLKRSPEGEAAGWPDDEFSADLGHGRLDAATDPGANPTRPLSHHEAARLDSRIADSADQITVLQPGTRLHQGGTYIDLERLSDGPFVARGGDEVSEGQLIAAKNELDYETWNVLVGRPTGQSDDAG